jgi:ribosome-associated protein
MMDVSNTGPGRSGPANRKERTIPKKTTAPERDKTLDLVTGSLDDDKAEDIVAIDLAGKSSIGDHMVIASGRSTRQVSAMANHLIEKLKQSGIGRVSVEGLSAGDWVLIDAGDIIVHLFRPEVREFYALEKMWGVDVGAETVLVGDGARRAANA